MKKLLIALAAVLVTVATHGQAALGTVVFNNRVTAFNVDAPVTLGSPTGAGAGAAYSAGLYFNGTLVPGSTTTFRDGTSNPALAKYINGVTVPLPGTAPGQQNVPVQMRVWLTSAGSYEAAPATQRASSADLLIATLGGGADPTANNNLPPSTVFSGLVVPVPEPSTLALGVLGAAALLLRRRK